MLALASAIQCKPVDEICISTKRFPYPSLVWYILNSTDILPTINEMFYKFVDERKSITNFEWIRTFNTSWMGDDWDDVAPFTQLIWDNAVAVGCSILRNQTETYIICIYSDGNNEGEYVYEVGQTGSKCEKGLNPVYPGLCNINEFPITNSESPIVNKWIVNGKTLDSSTWNK